MAKLTKNNSLVSILAIIIAAFALFAGVSAVMKVNADQKVGASASAADSDRCRIGCGKVVGTADNPTLFQQCLKVCPTVLGGTSVTNACSDKYGNTALKNSCISVLNQVMAVMPSAQCATYVLGKVFSVEECALVESGDKTCNQVCGSKSSYKTQCLSRCNNIVPTE